MEKGGIYGMANVCALPTYASPEPPTWLMEKIYKKCSSDYFNILHVVEMIALVQNKMFEFCWPMYADLGWPGDT